MASLIPDLLPVLDAQVVRTDRGTTYIWHPAPTLFVTRVEGVLTEQAARAMYVEGRRVVAADGRLRVFQDWEEVTGYDREARAHLTKVALDLRRQVEMSHFLVRARIVALGVQIANVVLGNLTVAPTRQAFERLLRETVRDCQTRAAAS